MSLPIVNPNYDRDCHQNTNANPEHSAGNRVGRLMVIDATMQSLTEQVTAATERMNEKQLAPFRRLRMQEGADGVAEVDHHAVFTVERKLKKG